MKDSTKRDFVSQIIKLVEEENDNLNNQGFTTDGKLTTLIEKKTVCEDAEIKQQKAMAKSKEATQEAKLTLNNAYKEASNMADAIAGILGKQSEIVKRMRKFRN